MLRRTAPGIWCALTPTACRSRWWRSPARGASRAKNRGVEEMEEGDLVVFTDDDTIVCPDWLIAMREAADPAQRP